MGITRTQIENEIYLILYYISMGQFDNNSYTNFANDTYYGPQSANFDPSNFNNDFQYHNMWTPGQMNTNMLRYS